MASAIYTHKQGTPEGNSPRTVGPGYSVCLHIAFDGVPGNEIDDPGLWFHNIYKSGKDEEGHWLVVFDGSDGSTDIERAHQGCVGKIKSIALSRGVELENEDITCMGLE